MVVGGSSQREMEVKSSHISALVWKCWFSYFEVGTKQLMDWHMIYRIPDNIELFILSPDDQADDLSLDCVALNPVMLDAGLYLFFLRIIKKFLKEWGIAPTQLCPNG
ncbi:hypothetical protein Adt_23540 [Abeliophyllum distichum]|uniref:Uncharacterized protein n=1 Tax=Abeliophyllum distichum TaxID=126358 RepID=A0ABD1SBE6_9LAMI